MSSKWGQDRDIYYRDNPDTREGKYYNAKIWAAKMIGKLIEISLDLWETRNGIMHGNILEEQNGIKRVRTMQLVTAKYKEGRKQ